MEQLQEKVILDSGVITLKQYNLLMNILDGDIKLGNNTEINGELDVTGDTSVSTFDSSGATSLATGGGIVNISKSGVMTTIKGTLNVDQGVTGIQHLE